VNFLDLAAPEWFFSLIQRVSKKLCNQNICVLYFFALYILVACLVVITHTLGVIFYFHHLRITCLWLLKICFNGLQLLTLLKSLEPYSFPKGTSREEVCSRLIKPTTQAYLGNVGLLTNLTRKFDTNST
jgi:hypothetical protein